MRLWRLPALLLTALVTPPAAAAEPTGISTCGVEIATPGDYVLSQDIGPCAGNGIVITAPDVRLNLAGYSVLGEPETGGCNRRTFEVGISVGAEARNVSVRGGSVSRFPVGVFTLGTGTEFSSLRLLDNCRTNAELRGDGASLARSDIRGGDEGVAIWADGVAVSGNHIHGSLAYGVNVAVANGSTIERNIIDENGLGFFLGAGIVLFGSGHTVRENAILDNLEGFQILDTEDMLVERNDVNGNVASGIIVLIDSMGLEIRGNRARGNRLDAVEDNDCPANSWTDNDFGTTRGCID